MALAEPLPGTSSDHIRTDEVDIGIIVGEEDDGPRLRELLTLNQLKLVPINCEQNENCQHANERRRLETEVSKLQRMVASSSRALEEANETIAETDITSELLQNIVKVLLEEDDRQKEAAEALQRKFEEVDERAEMLQLNLTNQRAVFEEFELQRDLEIRTLKEENKELKSKFLASEETVNTLRSQVKEANDQILAMEAAKEAVSKETADLQRKLTEERGRRNNEIIALKNENERLTNEKFSFIVFLRQLTKRCDFRLPCEEDMLTSGGLKQLGDHIEKLVKPTTATEDRSELLWSRDFINQMESLFSTRRKLNSTSSTSGTTCETNTTINPNDIQTTPDDFVESASTPAVSTPVLAENVLPSTPPRSHSPSLPPTPPSEQPTPEKVIVLEKIDIPLSPEPIRQPLITEEASPPNNVASRRAPSPKNVPVIPKIERDYDDEDTASSVGRTPSIVISLSKPQGQQPTPAAPPPQQEQSSSFQQPRPNPEQSYRQQEPLIEPIRTYRQFTEFAITTKRHGVAPIPDKLFCLCKKEYKTKRGLEVHVQKMTKQWRFKCSNCNQYFFFKSDLQRHLKTNNKCGGGRGESFDIIDDLLSTPSQQQQKKRQPAPVTPKAAKRAELRKLQQEILKRKKHAPWLSKVGTVQGSWYCTCMSKFKCKGSLLYHIQYWSMEWKFQCEHCHQKFFSFSRLRKHLKLTHGIHDAFSEFSVGCHLCGAMFQNRSEFFAHKKEIHNIHHPPRRPLGERNRTASKPVSQSQRPTNIPRPSAAATPPPQQDPDFEVIDVSSGEDDNDDDEIVIVDEPHRDHSSSPVPSTSNKKRKRIVSEPGSPSNPRKKQKLSKKESTGQRAPRITGDPGCECKKKFKTKKKFKRHLTKMKSGKALGCYLCSENFKELDALKRHMVSTHDKIFDGFVCAFCDKPYTTTKEYAMHQYLFLKEHEDLEG